MVLPKLNMVIGLTALSFQAFILYPWHNVISEQMDKLDLTIRTLEQMQTQLVKEADLLQSKQTIKR